MAEDEGTIRNSDRKPSRADDVTSGTCRKSLWGKEFETRGFEARERFSQPPYVAMTYNFGNTPRYSTGCTTFPDLASIAEIWPKLPDAVRAGIVAMAKEAAGQT